MADKITINKEPSEKRELAISQEIERFEQHTKSLNKKANDIINTLKETLQTTQDQGLSPDTTADYEGVEKEKYFIESAISLLKKDIDHIEGWAKQSKELERQIADIIDQLEEEWSTIDSRLRKMQTPYFANKEIVNDFISSKKIGKPLLLQGPEGIGRKSFIYAFGVEYDHRIIRIKLTKKTNINNLFFEIDLTEEHVIFGPLGHAVIELQKWKSKQDKEAAEPCTRAKGEWYMDDSIPIVMVEGAENVDQETLEKVISELEHDKMSFNIGNFDINYACHVRPFIVILNNPLKHKIPFHSIVQCLELDLEMPDKNTLAEIASVFFPSMNEETKISKITQYLNQSSEENPSTMRGLLGYLNK